jgi:hypothetical protein
MLPQSISAEREPERSISPGEQTAPPRPNSPRSKECGFFCGIKPLRRRSKALWFWKKTRKWKGKEEILFRPRERRKALKGKAQERWKLKEVSKGEFS